jgi:hypothetical protein
MNTIKLNGNMVKVITFIMMVALISGSAFAREAMRGGGFHGGMHGGFSHHGWYGHGDGFFLGPGWFWGPTIVYGDVPYYYYDGSYYRVLDGDMVAVEVPIEKPKPIEPAQAVATSQKKEPAIEATGSTQKPVTKTMEGAQAKDQAINEIKPSGDLDGPVTINVPNEKGDFTPVKLVKHDKGYIGPQGEFYADHPTVEQLKALYGK